LSKRKYFYGLISTAQELKALHDEAALHGKKAVGLSRGKNFYVWDDSINNIRTIKTEEAARLLELNIGQVDQIINTNAAVVFEEPEPVVESLPVEPEVAPLEEIPLEDTQTPAVEETALVEPVNEPEPVSIYPAAPEESGEKNEECNCALKELLDTVLPALTAFRAKLDEK